MINLSIRAAYLMSILFVKCSLFLAAAQRWLSFLLFDLCRWNRLFLFVKCIHVIIVIYSTRLTVLRLVNNSAVAQVGALEPFLFLVYKFVEMVGVPVVVNT